MTMTLGQAMNLIEFQLDFVTDSNIATAFATIQAELQQAQDLYELAEKFAKADDDYWAASKAGATIAPLWNAHQAARQAMFLHLRNRKKGE